MHATIRQANLATETPNHVISNPKFIRLIHFPQYPTLCAKIAFLRSQSQVTHSYFAATGPSLQGSVRICKDPHSALVLWTPKTRDIFGLELRRCIRLARMNVFPLTVLGRFRAQTWKEFSATHRTGVCDLRQILRLGVTMAPATSFPIALCIFFIGKNLSLQF